MILWIPNLRKKNFDCKIQKLLEVLDIQQILNIFDAFQNLTKKRLIFAKVGCFAIEIYLTVEPNVTILLVRTFIPLLIFETMSFHNF